MTDLSEENLKKNCPHCDPHSFDLQYKLETSDNFYIICDSHPLIEGHILIIPKQHLSCIGVYPSDIIEELQTLYQKTKYFLHDTYGSVSTFEHGIVGQTVFHSHIQMFPYKGKIDTIIPEGEQHITTIGNIIDLQKVYAQDQQYMFVSIEEKNWIIDKDLGKPGFFRIRFGKALGREERARWKEMDKNKVLMQQGDEYIKQLMDAWKQYSF
jgi:diadenosine tetraphosphate (Ap4A) HIT family hydrolase